MNELDLKKPIFVIYVNVEGSTRVKAEDTLLTVKNHFNFSNITSWIIASDHNKIELIWQGSDYSDSPGVINAQTFEGLILKINDILEILSSSTTDESLKMSLRSLTLERILS